MTPMGLEPPAFRLLIRPFYHYTMGPIDSISGFEYIEVTWLQIGQWERWVYFERILFNFALELGLLFLDFEYTLGPKASHSRIVFSTSRVH